MINAENISLHEFIGLNVEIVKSSNPKIFGMKGLIVDETKNMLVLDTVKGQKLIPKANSTWKFSIKENEVLVDGSSLTKRPEDRLRIKA